MSNQEDEAFELLAALEAATPDEIRARRHHDRRAVRARASLSAAHTGAAGADAVQAVIGDVSRTGCRLLAEVPLQVGQIYRIEFTGEGLDARVAFGRVVRCKLLAEDSFDTGVQFFGPSEMAWAGEVGEIADVGLDEAVGL